MSITSPITTRVRAAAPADVPALAATLSASFADDPVMSWCFPDAGPRPRLLEQGFSVLLAATLPHGGVHTVTDEASCAIWVPPAAQLDERLAEELVASAEDYAERMATLMGLMDDHHPQAPEHQYLFVLGTRPGWQSRGLGSALLRPVLADCDRDGVPAYLEATSERNRRLYERHGFRVREVITLPDGPPLWCMWRTPHGRGDQP